MTRRDRDDTGTFSSDRRGKVNGAAIAASRRCFRIGVALLVAVGIVLCTMAAGCTSPQSASAPDVEMELRASAVEWDRAFNAADVTTLVGLYAADAVSMPFNAPVGEGRAALQTAFEKFFSENRGARHETSIEEVQVAPTFAIERARYRMTFTSRQDGKTVVETGRHVMCRRRIDGRWLIVWEIFNADPA